MKIKTSIALLILTINLCHAQTFDVENERLPRTTVLTIKSFNGCCAKKGFRGKYYFNEKGQAIRSEHFFKRQKRAEYDYQYDSLGNLTLEISTYNINRKGEIDTNGYNYDFDTENRIVKKTYWTSPEYSWTSIYSDFNESDEPREIILFSSTRTDTTNKILEYNELGLVTKIQFREGDSIRTSEILEYNEQGDLSYSLIPSIVGKEDEPLAIWAGGNRHAPEERYEYTYDEQNRWTEKYVLYEDKKVLLETRNYK